MSGSTIEVWADLGGNGREALVGSYRSPAQAGVAATRVQRRPFIRRVPVQAIECYEITTGKTARFWSPYEVGAAPDMENAVDPRTVQSFRGLMKPAATPAEMGSPLEDTMFSATESAVSYRVSVPVEGEAKPLVSDYFTRVDDAVDLARTIAENGYVVIAGSREARRVTGPVDVNSRSAAFLARTTTRPAAAALGLTAELG